MNIILELLLLDIKEKEEELNDLRKEAQGLCTHPNKHVISDLYTDHCSCPDCKYCWSQPN